MWPDANIHTNPYIIWINKVQRRWRDTIWITSVPIHLDYTCFIDWVPTVSDSTCSVKHNTCPRWWMFTQGSVIFGLSLLPSFITLIGIGNSTFWTFFYELHKSIYFWIFFLILMLGFCTLFASCHIFCFKHRTFFIY